MSVQNLEIKYIRYLDEIHFKGYAEQLLFDNEKAFYKGMRQFLINVLEPEEESKKEVFEKIIKGQWECPVVYAQEVGAV